MDQGKGSPGDGYLPEAVLNYLVRLGWSHDDQEIFSLDEMIELFDTKDINHSASTFNPEKLLWLNQQYLKKTDSARLAELIKPFMAADCCDPDKGPRMTEVIDLRKERVNTIEELADAAVYFYRPLTWPYLRRHVDQNGLLVLSNLIRKLALHQV